MSEPTEPAAPPPVLDVPPVASTTSSAGVPAKPDPVEELPDPEEELYALARSLEPTAHVVLRGHNCPRASAFLLRVTEQLK